MNDLDELVRDGLRRAAADVPETSRHRLASELAVRRRGPDRRRAVRVLVAAALVAAVSVGGLALAASVRHRNGDDRVRVVTKPPKAPEPPVTKPPTSPQLPDEAGFNDLGPGWHSLDTGPVPAVSGVRLAWTGSELVVAEAGYAPATETTLFAYSPAKRSWRRLAELPFHPNTTLSMVWTGSVLVVVDESFPASHAAAWDPRTNAWRDIGPPKVAPALAAVGVGPRSSSGGLALMWTGEGLLDLTHGSAWDPDTSTWSLLPFPDNVQEFGYLVGADPVLVGNEVVLAAWGSAPGLAWDATGTSVREVPGLPNDLATPGGVVENAVGTAADGGVLLVSGTDEGRAAVLDPAAGTWRRVPSVPGSEHFVGCPRQLVTVSGHAATQRCDNGLAVVLTGDRWSSFGPPPYADAGEDYYDRWLGAGDALVSWSTDTDPRNPKAPYVHAAVWVPGGD